MKNLIIIFAIATSVSVFAVGPAVNNTATDPLLSTKAFDKDGNGQINGAEIQTLKQAYTGTTELRAFDTNKNGVLEDAEINALKNAFTIAINIKTFDTNNNGQFEDSELNDMNSSLSKLGKSQGNIAKNTKEPENTGVAFANPVAAAAQPAQKPKQAQPAAVKPPAAKATPGPSIGELALEEVMTCDVNKDGKIMGLEILDLRKSYASNPKSWLYIYDEDSNKLLDNTEIGKINDAIVASKQPLRTKAQGNAAVKAQGKGTLKVQGKSTVKDAPIKL